jgi:putative membrane protein
MALDAIASQIEEPFGTDDNDLALDALSEFIEDAARDLLAQPSLQKTAAKDGYLLT